MQNSGEGVSPARIQRKRLSHERPSWIPEDTVYFITVCCVPKGVNQLCKPDVASKVFETIAFRQGRGDWRVHLCVLMPDHVHALVFFPLQADMRKIVFDWKQSVARRTGVAWQRDFFDHRLRDDENRIAKAHYIRMNPVRKGLVETMGAWPYIWPKQKE